MKKYMLVVIDRYNVSNSTTIKLQSSLSDRKDVLCAEICELFEIDSSEFEAFTIKESVNFIGIDCEEESYLLIEL